MEMRVLAILRSIIIDKSIEDIQGFRAEPAVAADGASITAFRDIKSLQPAPLLNFIVRRQFAKRGLST